LTQPTVPTESGEPAVIGAAAVAVINAVLVLLGVLSFTVPAGLGAALAGVVAALVIAVPVVVGFVVRAKVTPVAVAQKAVIDALSTQVPAHFDVPVGDTSTVAP
jgi:hypothetical protein